MCGLCRFWHSTPQGYEATPAVWKNRGKSGTEAQSSRAKGATATNEHDCTITCDLGMPPTPGRPGGAGAGPRYGRSMYGPHLLQWRQHGRVAAALAYPRSNAKGASGGCAGGHGPRLRPEKWRLLSPERRCAYTIACRQSRDHCGTTKTGTRPSWRSRLQKPAQRKPGGLCRFWTLGLGPAGGARRANIFHRALR